MVGRSGLWASRVAWLAILAAVVFGVKVGLSPLSLGLIVFTSLALILVSALIVVRDWTQQRESQGEQCEQSKSVLSVAVPEQCFSESVPDTIPPESELWSSGSLSEQQDDDSEDSVEKPESTPQEWEW